MRLFVAIDLPDPVKDQLLALKTPIPTARWVKREQMHLTLFFIGETQQLAAIKAALAGIQAAPFQLTLLGIGRFPSQQRRPPRVLWVGVGAQPALPALQQQVTTALLAVGCQADDRPFSPHITLARLKTTQPLPAMDAFLKQHPQWTIPAIHVNAFVLFSSTLTPQGAHYRREAVYTLDQT